MGKPYVERREGGREGGRGRREGRAACGGKDGGRISHDHTLTALSAAAPPHFPQGAPCIGQHMHLVSSFPNLIPLIPREAAWVPAVSRTVSWPPASSGLHISLLHPPVWTLLLLSAAEASKPRAQSPCLTRSPCFPSSSAYRPPSRARPTWARAAYTSGAGIRRGRGMMIAREKSVTRNSVAEFVWRCRSLAEAADRRFDERDERIQPGNAADRDW